MSEEGASATEQLIEAGRRNNVELLESLLQNKSADQIASLINESRDPLGNTVLHVAAQNGSYETLDHILDQEGVEVDPINRLDGDTPLHCIVKYARDEPEHGAFLAEMMIEAGADPRIKNRNHMKPIDLVDKSNQDLYDTLRGAELALMYRPEVNGKVEDKEDDDNASDYGTPSDEE